MGFESMNDSPSEDYLFRTAMELTNKSEPFLYDKSKMLVDRRLHSYLLEGVSTHSENKDAAVQEIFTTLKKEWKEVEIINNELVRVDIIEPSSDNFSTFYINFYMFPFQLYVEVHTKKPMMDSFLWATGYAMMEANIEQVVEDQKEILKEAEKLFVDQLLKR